MRPLLLARLLLIPWAFAGAEEPRPSGPWRQLPLIRDGKVAPEWTQMGFGSFTVDEGALRTDCDERGMGLLLYGKEMFGDCQVRVVFRSKDPRSNAGVFVRIDEGILERVKQKASPVRRNREGKLSGEELKKLMTASEKGLGPWYAVHHGYEVQIMDAGDEYHRTGAIYSLAKAALLPGKKSGAWRTMVITLKGNRVLVDLDGKRVTDFDPSSKDVPARRQWFEPRREPRRPHSGYLGLQNHDPGDVVWFREVSIRPLRRVP